MGLFDSSSTNQTTQEQQVAGQSTSGAVEQIGAGGLGANIGGQSAFQSPGANFGSGNVSLVNSAITGGVTISDTPAVVSAALDAFGQANQTSEQAVAALHEDTTTALADVASIQQSNAALAAQLAQQNSNVATVVPSTAPVVTTSSGFNLTTTETVLAALAALLAILFYLHKK